MKNKNVYYAVAVVVLLIIIGAVWYSSRLNKSQPQTGAQPQPFGQTQDNKDVPKPPEIPKFIGGIVSRIEGQNIFIKSGTTEEKTITTDAKTVVISEVKDGKSYKNIPATFKDIKILSNIVVYYSQNSGLEYRADKIQILPF